VRSFVGAVALICVLCALASSGAAAFGVTSSPGVLAKALLSSPLQDSRLSLFGRAEPRAAHTPGGATGIKFAFVPSDASILYAVGSYPDDVGDAVLGVVENGSIQTTRKGPAWLPARSVIVTATGVGPKKWVTEAVFVDGVVGVIATTASASTPTSRDIDDVLGLARAALDHLHSVEHAIGWRPVSFVNIYRVPSSSMEPTLHCARPGPACQAVLADHVRIKPLGQHPPSRGDILVFKTPPAARQQCGAGGIFIKRLIGLPGETVQEKLIGGKGYIFIDGRTLKEPYVQLDRRDTLTGTWRVPRGDYYLMGDNRAQSCDSREWGPVPRKNILGRVVEILRGGKVIPVP
jgi:signal peptidase I